MTALAVGFRIVGVFVILVVAGADARLSGWQLALVATFAGFILSVASDIQHDRRK